ncbi:MAG: polysaccharide biosynthesis tyrosine autokinase [Paludibacteraceae bacterium]|nr:polysaccharide biosynthesis tyrosine autokinase [Paludibacteraceae bacterium]
MAQEIQNQEIDIRAWVMRILKNWYWFALSCVIFGGLGVLTYLSKTYKFTVDAQIMLNSNENENSFMPQSELMGMMGVSGMKNTEDEIEVLTSRDKIAEIVRTLDLQTEYRKKDQLRWVGQYPHRDISINYAPMLLDTTSRAIKVFVKVRKKDYSVKVKFGKHLKSKHIVTDLTEPFNTCIGPMSFTIHRPEEIEIGDKFEMSTLPMLLRVNEYKNAITAALIKKESNVINISTVTDMPGRAKDFILMEIDLYNQDVANDKNMMASSTAIFLDERIALLKKDLLDAETEIARYQEEQDIVDFGIESELSIQEGTEYRKRLAEVETQLHLVQFVEEFLADTSKTASIIPANLGLYDESLVKTIEQYNALVMKKSRVVRTAGVENPILKQIDMQLAMVCGNLEVTLNNVRQTLSIKKADLQERYDIAKLGLGSTPGVRMKYVEMLREKRIKEELYLFLSRQREENALTLASAVVPVKVIATPQVNPTPVSPKLKIYGLFFLILGLGCPLGIMILYDVMNNRISNDYKELEKKLKVSFGGMLVKNHRGEHVAVREGENSVSAELFRTLRTNIRFMQPVSEACPVMLVTSSVNGEGKSYVATNLAISMALLGKKVALVGLDIRKPMLANYLNLPSQGCLTSYLSDKSYTLEDTIVASSIRNLDVLPAGVIPPNPSELLQSDRLDLLFAELRKQYDCVVIDSAPVALVSDTFLLNRVADMTIYVTRANYTTFDLIDFLNQTHEQQRLPKMIAVLNGVDAKKIGYGYGYGYGHDTQKKNWWQRKKA